MTTEAATLSAIDPARARRCVLERATPLPARRVALAEAAGRVLAEPVAADRDAPPFDRAMMDGYGVRAADAGNTVRIVGEVAAGASWNGALRAGEAIEIMTGAPCPPDVEAVVPVEQVRRDGERVRLPDAIRPGVHIARRGSESRAGDMLLEPGRVLTPLAVAVLAAAGVERPLVHLPPSVGVIVTGDELGRGADPAAAVRDSNGPMLAALLGALGVAPARVLHAGDAPGSLEAALERCADCDVILLTGGVSAGKFDGVPAALADFGAQQIFHKATQKPGKPLLLAARGRQLIFGLPGNPLAVHLSFHRYVAAAIRRLSARPADPPAGEGRLCEDTANPGDRTLYQLVRCETDAGAMQVAPLRHRGSADIFGASAANGVIELAPGARLGTGDTVHFEWLIGATRDE